MTDPTPTPPAEPQAKPRKPPRRWLLTQNAELKEIGVYNWSIPAFVVQLSNGKHFNACPNAGVCASLCYARAGKFRFPGVKQAHTRNLEMILNDIEDWKQKMLDELAHKRYAGKHVRIHDAGDFFSEEYLRAWLDIARQRPNTIFYAYTKEVSLFRRVVEVPGGRPHNFRYLYSYGGKEDHLLTEGVDRIADIFPNQAAMDKAGYDNQDGDDLLAIYAPNPKVGIPYNKIPHYVKKLDGRTFQQMQREHDEKRDRKHAERLALVTADAEETPVEAQISTSCSTSCPNCGAPGQPGHHWLDGTGYLCFNPAGEDALPPDGN